MKISTKSCYGLRAMVYLAKEKKVCSVREISQKENIPFDFLGKIISALQKKNLVKAQRGFRGGYFLARSPQKISLKEILESLESRMSLISCGDACTLPKRKRKCLIGGAWKKIQNTLDSALDSITLADVTRG